MAQIVDILKTVTDLGLYDTAVKAYNNRLHRIQAHRAHGSILIIYTIDEPNANIVASNFMRYCMR